MTMEPVTTDATVIDLHDTQTVAQMTDRELMECMVAYLGSLDNRLAVIEETHRQVQATVDEIVGQLATNPMFKMFLG